MQASLGPLKRTLRVSVIERWMLCKSMHVRMEVIQVLVIYGSCR
jgi:hypothetical protein